MPVLAVKAASMSSSAFFIEAAAKTVSVLSSALAGEKADPHRIRKAEKTPARRYIRALHACSRTSGLPRTRKSGVGSNQEARRSGSAVPSGPGSLRPPEGSRADNNRLAGGVKAVLCLLFAHSEGRIAIEMELFFDPETCTTNGLAESSYFTVLRKPSQSVAPLKALGFRKWPSCTTSI